MSGGIAYVYDDLGQFEKLVNKEMVETGPLEDADDEATIKRLLENHSKFTGSVRAKDVLAKGHPKCG